MVLACVLMVPMDKTWAQTLDAYGFSTGTGATWYSPTWTTIIESGKDDAASSLQSMGFTFTYDGTGYTQFSANSNGNLRLGSTVISSSYYSTPFGSSYYNQNEPKIIGIGKDLSTGSAGYVRTGLYGSSGSYVRVIEFKLNTGSSTSGTTYILFQVQLFEKTKEVKLVYSSSFTNNPDGFQIGLGNASYNRFWYVNPTTHTATYSTTYNGSTYSTFPAGSNRYYSFAPPHFTGSSTSYYISNFTTTGGNSNINNSTSGTGLAYNNYYGSYAASFYAGSTLNFSIGFSSGSYGHAVWVDWNQNGQFESDERMHNSTGYASGTHSGSFTIPSTTPAGDYRMRVIADYYGSNPSNPVEGNSGEFEDYKLTITIPTSTTLPTYVRDNYSLTQQIYTSSEVAQFSGMGASGNITSIQFYSGTNTTSRNLVIYMQNTTKSSFSSTTDWVTSGHTQVFSGTVDFSENTWSTITLDTPFPYDASKNLLLVVDDNTGSYASGTRTFYTYVTNANRAISVHSDGTNYSATSSYTGTLSTMNSQLKLNIEAAPVTVPYTENFDNNTHGWKLINGSCTNQWYWGTPGGHSGSGLYISSDGGGSCTYNTSSKGVVYAYRLVTFEAGDYKISFDHRQKGESSWDCVGAMLYSQSYDLQATNSWSHSSGFTNWPTGYSQIIGGSGLSESNGNWITPSWNFNVATAGTYKLVIAWKNDGSGGTQPPASIDNVVVKKAYTIAVSANPSGSGTVSGGGQYPDGSSVTVTATPGGCYKFVNWTENGTAVSTNASYTFTVSANRTLVANFAEWEVNPNTANVNTECISSGSQIVLTAGTDLNMGLDAYRFSTGTSGTTYSPTWSELIGAAKDDEVSSVTNIGFDFTYDGVTYTQFSANSNGRMRLGSTVIGTTYSNPFTSGNYSGNTPAIVGVGKDCSTGAAGYVKTGLSGSSGSYIRVIEFLLNYDSGTSSTNYIKFQIQLFQATGEVRIVYCSDYTSTPSSYQIGIGNASYNKFWYVNPSNHTATYSTTYTSTTYSVHPGAGRYYSFVPAATPPTYAWTYTGTAGTANGNVYTVSPTQSSTYTVSATSNGCTHTESVSVTVSPATPTNLQASNITSTTATVSWSGSASSYQYNYNGTWRSTSSNSVNLTGLTPGTNYTFQVKAINGSCESSTVSTNFTTLQQYTVNASANPSAGGNVSPTSTTVDAGSNVTLNATANTGYTIVNWTDNGSTVNAGNTQYTISNIQANHTVTANFQLNTYTITATTNPTAGGTITGAGTYNYGAAATLIATPSTGYHFINWTENGDEVSTNATYSFTVTGARDLVANFTPDTYTITATANPTAGGTVSGDGTYNYGAAATLSATPSTGYHFVNWTENGDEVSTNATYSFTATEAASYIANFERNTMTLTAEGDTWTYDGQSHVATVTPEVTEGTTLYYRITPNDQWSTNVPSIINVGTLHVYVKATNANYADSYADCMLEVTPKAATIAANNANKVYGGEDPDLTAEVTGTVGNDALTYTLSRAEGENVGTYTITVTASADDNPNYSITTTNGTFTITPATVTVTAENKSKTYGDADPDLTWTAEGFQNNDDENMLTVSISRAEGEAAGTYTITPSGATTQGNYNVVYTTGTFTIDRAKVNVIADNKSKTYGAADPELTWTAEGLRNNDTEDVLTVSISRADGETVGEYTITPSGAATQGNYTVEYETGTFTINAKTATIAANNDSKTYGDDDPTLTAEVTGVLEGDELTYTLSREEGESVGNYTITVTASADANTNYSITTSNGTFTITPKAATIAANNANKVYGEEDPDLTAEVSGIVGNDVLTYELEREEGEDVDTYTISVVVSADDNPNYSIATSNGTFTITPATVTVTAENKSKTYGDIDPDLTWTVEGLQNDDDDDVLTVSISRAEGEVAGTYTITPTGAAVQGNYNVLYENGTFTINRATATVTAVDNSKVYGTADPELTADVTGLQNNDDASVISYTISRAEGETVGEYTITPTGAATQGNYTVEYETSTFTITPASVTVNIVGNYNAEDYDGEEHTVSGYTISSIMMGEEETELYTEDDFTYSGDAMVSRTDAGTSNMGLSADDFENTNTNFEEVTFNIVSDGYITINPISAVVTITGTKDTVDYDGEEHTATGYTAIANTELYDVRSSFEFGGTASATRADVGTTYMGLTAEDFTNTNGNFSTVTFNVTDGNITINPVGVVVTIVGHTEEADYDGNAHTVNGYDVTSITIGNEPTQLYTANDFTFNGTASATRTNVVEGEDADGTTDMGLTPDMFTNGNTNFTDVIFNVTDGSITINPITATVNITGNYSSDAYDGEEHEVTGYEVTSILIGEEETELYTTNDFTFTGTASASRTNVVEGEDADGTTNMGLTADMFANINTNFTDVTFNVTDGYQTITPITATVTIVGNHDIKDFDGEEHAVNGYEVTSIMVGEEETELYTEDDFTFSGTASAARTDAGTTNMNLTEGQFTNNNTNFSTVTFEITDGYITVNAVDAIVTIVGSVDTVTYDGTEHTVTHYTATANTDLYDVEEDFTFTPGETSTIVEDEIAATRTDVGTTYMGLTDDMFENTNENFAHVTFNVTDGHITINPAAITIIADENGKVYGAAEPTTLTATVEGVPESGVDPVYTVSRAEGEDVGEYPITVTPSADANPNYTITTVGGVFTITPATVTVTADNKSKVYGTEDPDLTWTAEGFQNNDTEEVLTVSITRAEGNYVGDYTITPSGNAVQGNYNVVYETAIFSILPTVVFTTDPMPTDICSEGSISVAFDATIAGDNGEMTFAWSRNHTDDVTGAADGTGDIEDLTLTTATTQTVTFSVIPTFTPTEGEEVTGEAVTFDVVVNALPAVTATHTNVSCDALGSATLTVTNGDAPLTCLWNNETFELTTDGDNYSVTFNSLTGGEYPYVITNTNSCVTSGTITVEDPGRITISQSANSETCEKMGITVAYEIEGGTEPYTLTWVNADNETPVEETEVSTLTDDYTFTLPEGEYRLALIITDAYGCSSTSDDILEVTVWPNRVIEREITVVGGDTYEHNGVTYTYPDVPEDETEPGEHGCESTIHYVVNQYTLGISIADNCTLTRSSYTRAYSNTPHTLYGDTIYVRKNNQSTFYAYINDTEETMWNEEKMDMSYELLFNESEITESDMPNLVSNFSISSYYDRTGQYYGINDLTASTGEIPNNTLAFRQTANSSILHFDYFYFAAFKNVPNKVTLTGLENGTYTLKLKAELRHSTGGTNRAGIYNPYIVGRKYGHLWGGYGDRPGDKEVIAARTFTIIVNETGTNPNGAPMAVNEYVEGASVMAFPNPVNDQLNLRISGMSGATVITITDAQGKVVRTLNTELYGGEEVLTYSVADFAQGMYFINVRNSDTLVSEKFVVTRR